MKPKLTLTLLLLFSLISTLDLNAQSLPIDPLLSRGKLPNGFRYYIRKNNRPASRATIYLVVKAGSILETDAQAGLAHFIEHMSFNGTKNFPKNTQLSYLEKCGVRFGADLNAYTGLEETVYELPIPTDDPQILQGGLRIVRDWAQEATLAPEDIDAERGVIIEEMRQRLGRGQRLQEKQFPMLLNGSRYARRMPIGELEVLKNFKNSEIKSFYQSWYRPDLQALIVVGDIDVPKVKKMITSLFSTLKNPAAAPKRPHYQISLDGKNHYLETTDPEQPAFSIDISTKHYLRPFKTQSDLSQKLLRTLFSDMLNERLEKDALEPAQSYSGLSAGFSSLMGGIERFSIRFSTPQHQLQGSFTQVWALIHSVKRNGFSSEELTAAKKRFKAQLTVSAAQYSQTSAYLAGRYKKHFLTDEAFPGQKAEDRLYLDALDQASLADINQLAKDILRDQNRDILLTAPESQKSSLPGETLISKWIRSAQEQQITFHPAQTTASKSPMALAQNGKIISKINTKKMGVSEWNLSNGARVIICKRADPTGQVLFLANSPGGSSLYPDADFQSAANAASIVSAFGLQGIPPQQLASLMQENQLSLQPFITETGEGMQGSFPNANMQRFFELLYQHFTAPAKDKRLFDKIISDTREGISQRYANPEAVFADTISAVLSASSLRRTAPTQSKVDQINLERIMEIYHERFANAGDFTFFFVGNIDTLQLEKYCQQYLACLPDKGIREKAIDLGIRTPSGQLSKTIHAGIAQKATVRLILGGDYSYSLAEKLNISALQEILQYRLLRKLREEQGGVYTPQVASSNRSFPVPRYSFTINFNCDPQRVEALIGSAREEIRAMATSISQQDLDRYKAEQRRGNQMALADNNFYMGYLSSVYQDGESLDTFERLVSLMESLEVESLQAAAKRLLSAENYLRFVLLPTAQG